MIFLSIYVKKITLMAKISLILNTFSSVLSITHQIMYYFGIKGGKNIKILDIIRNRGFRI